jgi:nitroreductase
MLQRPTAAITICTDRALAAAYGFPADAPGLLVDVGTAMATILLAAHAIGVGAGPVTSFSRAAVAEVLQLPEAWRPELIVCLGHPGPGAPPPMRGRPRLTWRDLTTWFPSEPTAVGPDARAAAPGHVGQPPGTPQTP